MIKVNEREIAVYTLLEITDSKAYNNIALRKALDKAGAEKGAEENAVNKGFITELVNGAIRNLIYIDYVINLFSKTHVTKMKPLILCLIRTGVYQLLFMDKVPESAAVNEAVKLAKEKGFVNLSGFVNGVLRSVARNKDNILLPDINEKPIEYLSIKYSYPEWILNLWMREIPGMKLKEMLDSNSLPPAVTLCVNNLKTNKNYLKQLLKSEGVDAVNGKLNENALYLPHVSDMRKLKSFNSGLFHVMSESSMLAVEALDLKPGHILLDVCAAPGGKSFYAAELMENEGEIIALDIHEHRLKLIDDGALRLGADIIRTECADAAVFDRLREETADRLLIDAPCSGLGLVAKKPDIKYTKKETDIPALSLLQRDILSACAGYLKIGGIMVYSTCTLTYEENLGNIQWFTQNFGYSLDRTGAFPPAGLPVRDVNNTDGYISLIPDGTVPDGFFIAKLIRIC